MDHKPPWVKGVVVNGSKPSEWYILVIITYCCICGKWRKRIVSYISIDIYDHLIECLQKAQHNIFILKFALCGISIFFMAIAFCTRPFLALLKSTEKFINKNLIHDPKKKWQLPVLKIAQGLVFVDKIGKYRKAITLTFEGGRNCAETWKKRFSCMSVRP